jgi:flavin-dependent dehydrogenase
MNNKIMHSVEVLVIGGGPAGTTVAALLAEQGRQVTLLEKHTHPRFHIGESLLPGNIPILQRLGVLEEVRRIGVYKPGADFTGPDGEVLAFPFAKALGNTPEHSFQVRRSEFDLILFQNCLAKGVDARQQHRVIQVDHQGPDSIVTCTDADQQQFRLRARLVIDASGRDGFLARKHGWQRKSGRHASAAIFGHFTNVTRRQDSLEGNISVYWFDQGWVWMIPLPDDVMSIGAVCWPSALRERATDLETFLKDILAGIPDARERVQHAEVVSAISATGNYSYQSSRMYGEGFILVGDAYAFIDPVFSSGVFLAMNAGVQCLAPAEAWLAGDRREFRRKARLYAREVNSKINAFSWFIYRFTTPTMRDLFRNPRNDWQVEQAVISMLAGDGDGSADIRRRLTIFKTIYFGSWLKHIKVSLRAWWSKRKNSAVAFADETVMTERR